MSTYDINFENDSEYTWTFCVYQDWPSSPGLESLSWKQTTVPRSGVSGVQWSVDYLVAIMDYRQTGGKGVYTATQQLPTLLGQKWKADYQDNVQQLYPDGQTLDDQVIIANKSGKLSQLAIGMDGDVAMVKRGVYSNNEAQFQVEPTYYVALFRDLVRGEVISGNVAHGPLPVKFVGGNTSLTYRCYVEAETFYFVEKSSNTGTSAPLEEMGQSEREIDRRRLVAVA